MEYTDKGGGRPMARILLCDAAARRTLADALGDTPETVIAAHLLRRGLCRAHVAGDPARFHAAIVDPTAMLPGEPMAFGDDAEAVWEILRRLDGWFCVNASERCAGALGPLMERALGRPVRRLHDMCYALRRPPTAVSHPAVRLLGPADLALLDAAPEAVRGAGFGGVAALLGEGIVACALIDGRVVAIAHTSALTERHADIGAGTLLPWRGQGLATAAASLVAAQVRRSGRTPVWSTGEDNRASRRVAEKIGFEPVAQRVYCIPSARTA